MIEHTVKGIVSTLYENFDKKHIKGNELKNSMNALCECVSNKEDIKTVVKNKLEVVAETYNHFGGKVCPENYCEMMSVVCEGFNDTLADFAHRVKGKLVGTPEEAAQTVDYITDAIVNKLHQVYATKEQYVGKNIKGFGGTLVKLCLMVGNDESLIDSVLRNVIQQEVEVALESNPTINYRNRKRCVEFVKDCFGHAGGLMYMTSDLLNAAKQALGVNESKRNTTTLNESELNKMLVEAVTKNIKKLTEGRNDEPSNTHYAVHKPTNTIVFSWDYNGYDSDELRQFKKDYFISDLIDMGMDPKEVTILTRKACERKGINPTDDSCWSNYPMTEEKSYGTMQEAMDDYDNLSITESMEDIESNDIKNKEYDAIGFANKFYTLWHVIEREYSKTYVFRKNISFSKEKAFKLYPDAVYDENLRGKSRSFTISVGSGESIGERGWAAVPQTIVEKGSKIHIKQFLVTHVGYKVSRYGKPYTYFMGEDLNSSYGFTFYVNIFSNDKSLVPKKGDIIELEGIVGLYNDRNEDIYLNDCQYVVNNNNLSNDIEPNVKIEEEMVVVSNILPVYNTTGRFLEKPGMIIFQNEEGNEFVVDTVVEDFRAGSPTIKFENYRDIHRGDKFLVKGTTQIKNGMGRLIRVKLKLLEPYDPTENTQDGPNVRLITVRENISQKQGRQNTITSSKMYHLKTIDEIDKFVLHVWGIVEKYNCITGYSSKEELKQKILNIINDYQNRATNGFQTILEIPQTKEQISYVLTIYYN